jgi:hypothetical protein
LKETEDPCLAGRRGSQESEVDIHPNHMFIFLISDLGFLFFLASVSGLPTSDIIFDLSLNLPAAGGFVVEPIFFIKYSSSVDLF